MMTTEKLPEWPEKPVLWAMPRERDYYANRLAYAALARMEALVEVVRMINPVCDELHHGQKDRHSDDERCPVEKRIDDLLAACARKEGGK